MIECAQLNDRPYRPIRNADQFGADPSNSHFGPVVGPGAPMRAVYPIDRGRSNRDRFPLVAGFEFATGDWRVGL